MVSFIGIDMAWNIDAKHSGIAVMDGNTERVSLSALSRDVFSMADVIEFVRINASPDTVIAIDASLVVKNHVGQRPCETLIGKTFGRYHASCHTSNLSRPYATTGMRLVDEFKKIGFQHDFDIAKSKLRPGKWLFEVYPHPAMVRLFGLDKIIPYKKGPHEQRRSGLKTLQTHIGNLATRSPGLKTTPKLSQLLDKNLNEPRGRALKHHEDLLDAVFCAYLAWHCWRWGAERNDCFGTLVDGYIVVPKRY